jgi:NADH dehydrogenase
MGKSDAVASTMGIRWRGLPAWFLARSYHLLMLPGLKRKARLLVDWNLQILFGRDLSELGSLGHPPSLADVERPRGPRRRPDGSLPPAEVVPPRVQR